MAGGWTWVVFEVPSDPNHSRILWCLFFASEFTFTGILIGFAFHSSVITLGYGLFFFFFLFNWKILTEVIVKLQRRKDPKPSFLCLFPIVLEKQWVSWLTKLAWCMNWILNVTAMQVLQLSGIIQSDVFLHLILGISCGYIFNIAKL